MSSFNLAQVIPSLNSGGVERGTIDVANYLAEEQIHNTIISSGGKILDTAINNNSVFFEYIYTYSKKN